MISIDRYLNTVKMQFKAIENIIEDLNNLKFNGRKKVIVFDLDNTVFNNIPVSEQSAKQDQKDAVLAAVTAHLMSSDIFLPGVYDLINKITDYMDIVFISTRVNDEHDKTIRDMYAIIQMLKLKDRHFEMYLRKNDIKTDLHTYKDNIRKMIYKDRDIVACIADKLTDLDSDLYSIPFIIYNPWYNQS